MRRSSGFIAAGALVASSLVISVRTGMARDAIPINLVGLQSKTPGFQQTGNSNISGTEIAGTFQGSGSGLTGVPWGSLTGVPGTLLTLPYSGSSSSAATTFAITNAGDGTAINGTSNFGFGVYGASTATAGVYGVSTNFPAVYGLGSSGQGGYFTSGINGCQGGTTSTSGSYAGVVGSSGGGSSYGVYSNGNFGSNGTKTFRIYHPADPTHKYLLHYCSEGPEPRNVYQGHVTTGQDGYAWIDLPDYYSEINRDPEYTLTVVDSSDDFVLAKVTREVTGNRFQIRTSQPNVKVSWRVEGIRNDRWVQKYGAPVEQEKEGKAYGKYQAPELYGAPKSMGQFYMPTPKQAGGAGQPQASRNHRKASTRRTG